jgi:hypothetical protein
VTLNGVDVTGGADVVLSGDHSSGGTPYSDVVLSGWTVAHVAGDVYEFELKAVSGYTQIHLVLAI